MIVRTKDEAQTVDWGNGLSTRLLVAADGLGYTVTETTVRAGTKSRLEYRNHLEACYCVDGEGEVVDLEGTSHRIEPGVIYALDRHDAHFLIAAPEQDMRLVCVFTPALRGDERHNLDAEGFSQY
ncbi:ectoine synthase [Actinokineospora bangkokensis]|uniref:L-ectoine synthase n=1 Tax=Actinokineospora bangkokensis TaxID=1193682 RepID=A0A1Q9LC42_9PSEU|nr:ectoine synthase [Actinokineospora bangkokensis]OLR89584.1 L-ectoine synthase [Actinokineospora bangkokensis]